jgi:hypothetical protein
VARLAQIVDDAQSVRKADVRQVDGVRAPRAQLRRQRRVTRPQARFVTRARQVDGERRPPASGSQ